jgi:cytochrome P450
VIDGEPMPHDAAVNMVIALVLGGFDTTVTLACHSLVWLAGRTDVHERLLADPKVMDNAVEEFLRAFSPTHGTARTAVQDGEYFGACLRKGERTMLSWAGANRDPAVFECPGEVRIDRPNAGDHLAFGAGAHRCLGTPLARLEVKMIIAEVLRRLPDYRVDMEKLQRYPSAGLINGFIRARASFTPGPVE